MIITFVKGKKTLKCYKGEYSLFSMFDICNYMGITDIQHIKALYKQIDEFNKCRRVKGGKKIPLLTKSGVIKLLKILESKFEGIEHLLHKVKVYKKFFRNDVCNGLFETDEMLNLREQRRKLEEQVQILRLEKEQLKLETSILKLKQIKEQNKSSSQISTVNSNENNNIVLTTLPDSDIIQKVENIDKSSNLKCMTMDDVSKRLQDTFGKIEGVAV